MKIHAAMAAVCLAFAAVSAQAQNAEDPKTWSEQFLQAVSENIDKAYDRFREETVLGRSNKLAAEQLREASRANANALGHTQLIEVVAEQRLGQHWSRVTSLIHRRVLSEVYVFHFRRISEDRGWELHSVKIETNVTNFPWDTAERRLPKGL